MPADQDFFAVAVYAKYIYIDPKTISSRKNAADREFMFLDESARTR